MTQIISNIITREVYETAFFPIDGALVRQGEHQQLQTEGQTLKSLLRVEVYKNSFPQQEYSNLKRPGPKYPSVSSFEGIFSLKTVLSKNSIKLR